MTLGSTATVRVMSAEEISSQQGGETPFLRWPERTTHFAERAMRLRQLAPGHAMGDFLRFMADVAEAQQSGLAALADRSGLPLPTASTLARAAAQGVPAVPAVDWPRDPAWHDVLRHILRSVRTTAPEAAVPTLDGLAVAGAEQLERQADCLLTGVMDGLDLATAPLVAAALQVYWTQLLLAARAVCAAGLPAGQEPSLPHLGDDSHCPCCGSRPVASITRAAGGSSGQRYLHCSLCGLEWHRVRIQCTHCQATEGIAYLSLDSAADAVAGAAGGSERAARAAVQAETCDACGHYLKILHTDRQPLLEPVADDLASLTLDLLVSDSGKLRHGVNLMLLFGEPPPTEGLP